MFEHLKTYSKRAYYKRKAISNSIIYRTTALYGTAPEATLRVPQFGLNAKISINPMRIEGTFGKQHKDLNYSLLFQDGEWDRICNGVDVESKTKYKTIEEIMSGVPLDQTTEYLSYVRRNTEKAKPPKDNSEILEYLQTLKELYASVISSGEFEPIQSDVDPLKVAITREGKIVKMSNGNHRFALACYAKLPTIPVVVRLIHTENLSRIRSSGNFISDVNVWLRNIEAENST